MAEREPGGYYKEKTNPRDKGLLQVFKASEGGGRLLPDS